MIFQIKTGRMQCEPGDRGCINQRQYYQTEFKRVNPLTASTRTDFDRRDPVATSTTANFDRPTTASNNLTQPKPESKKDDVNTALGGAVLRVRSPLEPTINDLTPEQTSKAKMIKASRIAYEQDYDAAQAYLDAESIPYDIDVDLSSKESLVLLGDEGSKIAYRGTKIKNMRDVSADAMILFGQEEHHPIFKAAEEQLRLTTERHGAPNELLGYSLGGNEAMYLGNKAGIDTTTYNPFLGKNLMTSESNAHHTILRTTEDPASFAIGMRQSNDWNVQSILPHQDKLYPFEAHELHNFTETSTRRPGHTETMVKAAWHAGKKTGEYEILDSIKNAQERGESFTEFVHETNGRTGQDTTPDGSALAGKRMHRESKWVQLWEEAKTSGSSAPAFTPAEEAHFDLTAAPKSSQKSVIRPSERARFHQSTPEARQATIAAERANLKVVTRAADMHTAPYKAASSNLVKRSLHPTNMATGVAGGWAASEIMDVIDPDHKINETARTGLEGMGAGVLTELGGAALAGTAVAAPALAVAAAAGTTSYLAGSETTTLVTKGMEALHIDHNVPEVVGSAVGGGVGGAVAAGTAIAGAALFGTELGAMGGPLGMAVGAGIGTIFGTLGWLYGKATH